MDDEVAQILAFLRKVAQDNAMNDVPIESHVIAANAGAIQAIFRAAEWIEAGKHKENRK